MMSSLILVAQNLGSHHRSEADKERYIREFRTRPLFPTFKFFPEGFIKYGIPIFDSLFDIGWSSFVPSSPNPHCPEPVRLFYSNLRVTCSHPLQLQTLVYDTVINVTPALISFVLGAPLVGLTVHNNDQLAAARFDVPAALRALNYAQESTLPPLHIGRFTFSSLVISFHDLLILPPFHPLTSGSCTMPQSLNSRSVFPISCFKPFTMHLYLLIPANFPLLASLLLFFSKSGLNETTARIARICNSKSKKAKEIKELIIKLATKESERDDCSDYESDPEIDF
ncbi:hypothetical protein LINPERHAP2_LOCUS38210 [Linum perenne]